MKWRQIHSWSNKKTSSVSYTFRSFALRGRMISTENMPGGFNSGTYSSRMAFPIMVSLAPGDANLLIHRNLLQDPFNRAHSLLFKEELQLYSYLESVWHTCSLSGISERASDNTIYHSRIAEGNKFRIPVRLGEVDWLV